MIHVQGDAVKAFSRGEVDILIHQVNCQGKMNSGIAKQIREAYPQHYEDYTRLCEGFTSIGLFGRYVDTVVDGRKIVGVFGQDKFGYDGGQYTSYAALTVGISNTLELAFIGDKIAVPKGIGCGLGGADWSVVESILEDLEEIHSTEIYCYEL